MPASKSYQECQALFFSLYLTYITHRRLLLVCETDALMGPGHLAGTVNSAHTHQACRLSLASKLSMSSLQLFRLILQGTKPLASTERDDSAIEVACTCDRNPCT